MIYYFRIYKFPEFAYAPKEKQIIYYELNVKNPPIYPCISYDLLHDSFEYASTGFSHRPLYNGVKQSSKKRVSLRERLKRILRAIQI